MTVAPAFFQVESPYLIRNLKDRLETVRAEEIGYLTGAGDWPDFKYRVGRIAGIAEALRIIEDMEKKDGK